MACEFNAHDILSHPDTLTENIVTSIPRADQHIKHFGQKRAGEGATGNRFLPSEQARQTRLLYGYRSAPTGAAVNYSYRPPQLPANTFMDEVRDVMKTIALGKYLNPNGTAKPAHNGTKRRGPVKVPHIGTSMYRVQHAEHSEQAKQFVGMTRRQKETSREIRMAAPKVPFKEFNTDKSEISEYQEVYAHRTVDSLKPSTKTIWEKAVLWQVARFGRRPPPEARAETPRADHDEEGLAAADASPSVAFRPTPPQPRAEAAAADTSRSPAEAALDAIDLGIPTGDDECPPGTPRDAPAVPEVSSPRVRRPTSAGVLRASGTRALMMALDKAVREGPAAPAPPAASPRRPHTARRPQTAVVRRPRTGGAITPRSYVRSPRGHLAKQTATVSPRPPIVGTHASPQQ